jgi:hypothetical protein
MITSGFEPITFQLVSFNELCFSRAPAYMYQYIIMDIYVYEYYLLIGCLPLTFSLSVPPHTFNFFCNPTLFAICTSTFSILC